MPRPMALIGSFLQMFDFLFVLNAEKSHKMCYHVITGEL